MAPALYLMPLATRGIKEELGGSAMTYLNVWIYFNLVGNTILLPVVVGTFLFSKTAKRHPTLVNLCITWIFSGVFSLLLFYAKQHTGPDPTPSLCIAQASLLYGIRPMWSVAVLALVYYTLSTLREDSNHSKPTNCIPMTLMLSAPYMAQCSFTIAALLLSFQNPSQVNREQDFLFCSLQDQRLFLATSIFTVAMCAVIIILEGFLAVVIFRSWRTRREAGLPSELPVPLLVRVLLFGVYVIIGLSVSILVIFGINLPGDIFAATAGTVVFLIFGTQADVFQAWCFWRKDRDSPSSPPEPKSNLLEVTSQTSSAVFGRSRRSDMSYLWSNRVSRTLSQPSSSRRHSTRNFKRLHDEVEGANATEHAVPSEHMVQKTQPTNSSRPQSNIAESSKIPGAQATPSEPLPVGGLGKIESTRRSRRRDDLPRPKGPRKASISSVKTASLVGSVVTKPTLTVARPAEPVSTSVESSRTLDSVDLH